MKLLGRILLAFAFDPRKVGRALLAWPGFLRDVWVYGRLRRSAAYERFPLSISQLHPMLLDKGASAGAMGIYFHQDLYVARKIYHQRPKIHMDIGSRIDGFIAHLLVFMDVEIVDVRQLDGVDGLTCQQMDARHLTMVEDNSIESLSCLHALEHFGLGRYGDEVDPVAWETALAEMLRVLAPGGTFYLSVPIGEERVEFNAHRVFGLRAILEKLQGAHIESLCIADSRGLIGIKSGEEIHQAADLNAYEGCIGIFEVHKPEIT